MRCEDQIDKVNGGEYMRKIKSRGAVSTLHHLKWVAGIGRMQEPEAENAMSLDGGWVQS